MSNEQVHRLTAKEEERLLYGDQEDDDYYSDNDEWCRSESTEWAQAGGEGHAKEAPPPPPEVVSVIVKSRKAAKTAPKPKVGGGAPTKKGTAEDLRWLRAVGIAMPSNTPRATLEGAWERHVERMATLEGEARDAAEKGDVVGPVASDGFTAECGNGYRVAFGVSHSYPADTPRVSVSSAKGLELFLEGQLSHLRGTPVIARTLEFLRCLPTPSTEVLEMSEDALRTVFESAFGARVHRPSHQVMAIAANLRDMVPSTARIDAVVARAAAAAKIKTARNRRDAAAAAHRVMASLRTAQQAPVDHHGCHDPHATAVDGFLGCLMRAITNEADILQFVYQPDLKSVPAQICQATYVTQINFRGCKLTSLPDSMGALSLTKVYLANNCFEEIPRALLSRNMAGITVLDMSSNRLHVLPDAISLLVNLSVLLLDYNRLTYIPSLATLTRLEVLDVTDNNLKAIPADIGGLTKLWRLRLGANPIMALPPEVYHLGVKSILDFLRNFSHQSMPIPPSTMVQDMGSLLEEGTKADVIFETYGGGEHKAHMFMMYARCRRLYERCLGCPPKGAPEDSVRRVPLDVTSSGLKKFLSFVYTCAIETDHSDYDTAAVVQELQIMGAEYGCPSLLEALGTGARMVDRTALVVSAVAGLYDHAGTSDVVVATVDGSAKIHCHRAFLASRSGHFRSVLLSGLADSASETLTLDVSAEVLTAMLYFLYADDTGEKMAPDNVIGLMMSASEYSIPRLRGMAESMVGYNIDVDTVCQVIQIAFFLDSERLKLACTYFLGNNMAAVRQTDGWREALEPEAKAEVMRRLDAWNLEGKGTKPKK